VWCGVTRVTGSPPGCRGRRISGAKWNVRLPTRPWPRGSQKTSWTYSFPPSPKKFLHSFLGCLKNSRSRFKSFIFFRKKLLSFEVFDQMSAFWSMFWFKPFRNFLRKIAILWTFDHWSEILSLSAGRPISQDVCPPLPTWLTDKQQYLFTDASLLDEVSHVMFGLTTSVVIKNIPIGRYKQQSVPFTNQNFLFWIYIRGKL
jgi:hypothetical protein